MIKTQILLYYKKTIAGKHPPQSLTGINSSYNKEAVNKP